jgi:hypothetical protein
VIFEPTEDATLLELRLGFAGDVDVNDPTVARTVPDTWLHATFDVFTPGPTNALSML